MGVFSLAFLDDQPVFYHFPQQPSTCRLAGRIILNALSDVSICSVNPVPS